jgi:hypothetical protein
LPGQAEVNTVANQLARVDNSIALITADMDEHGESAALFQRLRAREAERKDLATKLESLRRQMSHPASEAWGEAQSLLATLYNTPDPKAARQKLQGLLAQLLDGIWLLVVPRGLHRFCAAQARFKTGKVREFFLYKASASHHTQGWCYCIAVDHADDDMFDLRDPGQVAEAEAELLSLPLLKGPPAPGPDGTVTLVVPSLSRRWHNPA